MATPTPPPPSDEQATDMGMAPNLAALLCYLPLCCIPIVAVVAIVVEKRNRFVRFHALQSLLLAAASILVFGALGAVSMVPVVGMLAAIVAPLLGLAVLALVVFLMVKAYNNEEYELPVIGEMAKQWV
jgi:uncharacterized membrane protein